MTIRQALLLIGFLILLLDDGFRELFFSALGVVLFLAVALGSPVFLYALIVGERADHRPGPMEHGCCSGSGGHSCCSC